MCMSLDINSSLIKNQSWQWHTHRHYNHRGCGECNTHTSSKIKFNPPQQDITKQNVHVYKTTSAKENERPHSGTQDETNLGQVSLSDRS